MQNLSHNNLNVIVYNFVDMLSRQNGYESYQRTSRGRCAYRSLTTSWFEHSPLKDMMTFISEISTN